MCRGICVAQSVWEMEDGADMVCFALFDRLGGGYGGTMARKKQRQFVAVVCGTEQGRAQE